MTHQFQLELKTLFVYVEPEALSYEIFMWGDIGLVTDVRYYGVAPHWYFRPFMAWLIACPHHKTGIFGVIFFFIVQTLCMQKSKIKLKNVCINYFRTGFIDILNKMGAKIKIFNKRKIKGEYVADILVKSKKLKNISVPKSIIPRTIDELPVLL